MSRSLIPILLSVGVPLVLLIVVTGAAYLRHSRRGQLGSGDGAPDACWKFGLVYVNRDDPALWVKKRTGLGYTLNFGHPVAAGLTLLVLVGVVLAIGFIPALHK